MAVGQSPERVREAKIFLACRIAEEAEREGLPLDDIERKMLYFSESGWTLEDMDEVNEIFERDYKRRDYEKRVGRLIRKLRVRVRAAYGDEFEGWTRAVHALRGEDHYLKHLIAVSKPRGELTRLVITALVVAGVMLLAIYLASGRY
jgi:hypothetical protein